MYRHRGEKRLKLAYEKALGCEAVTKMSPAVCNQSVVTRRNNAEEGFVKEIGYHYIADL